MEYSNHFPTSPLYFNNLPNVPIVNGSYGNEPVFRAERPYDIEQESRRLEGTRVWPSHWDSDSRRFANDVMLAGGVHHGEANGCGSEESRLRQPRRPPTRRAMRGVVSTPYATLGFPRGYFRTYNFPRAMLQNLAVYPSEPLVPGNPTPFHQVPPTGEIWGFPTGNHPNPPKMPRYHQAPPVTPEYASASWSIGPGTNAGEHVMVPLLPTQQIPSPSPYRFTGTTQSLEVYNQFCQWINYPIVSTIPNYTVPDQAQPSDYRVEVPGELLTSSAPNSSRPHLGQDTLHFIPPTDAVVPVPATIHQADQHELPDESPFPIHDKWSLDTLSPDQKELLDKAFTPQSSRPNPALRALLDDILRSAYLENQELEPLLSQDAGRGMVDRIRDLEGVPEISEQRRAHSIYVLFLQPGTNVCLFCGSKRSVLQRAVGCVRRHLEHRPFVCEEAGCCVDPIGEPGRFYTASLLRDHSNGKLKKIECVQCHNFYRRGNVHRHWLKMHRDIPFPSESYPRYHAQDGNYSSSSTDVTASPVTLLPGSPAAQM